jgi:hypothetical protein
VDSYSWTFDQEPGSVPPTSSKGSGLTTTIGGVADGIWYFHVRASLGSLWGPTSTFKVQIDGTNPQAFDLQMEPKPGGSALPLVKFVAEDATSGVEKYEIQLDDGPFVTVLSPYQLPQVKAGSHKITVKATDRAGNVTQAVSDLTVSPIEPKPEITSPKSGGNLGLGGGQVIEGKGPPKTSIQLFANDQYVAAVQSDDQGKFSFKVDDYFDPGKYTFTVKAVRPHHLDSAYSEPVVVTIDGIAGLKIGNVTLPAYLTIALYLLLLVGLIGLLVYLFIRWQKTRQQQRLAMQKLELITEEDVSQVHVEGTAPASTLNPPVAPPAS